MIMHTEFSRRILVIDDNTAIHEDFLKILAPPERSSRQLKQAAAFLFGRDQASSSHEVEYRTDVATHGKQGVELVRQACADGEPYILIFVDMRMPNGLNGIETTQKIWQIDPTVHIVLCTAFSDFSWSDIREQLSNSDRFLILKKPFDNIEVQQLAASLTSKSLSENKIRTLAFTDALTGLPNRRLLIDRLHQLVSGAARTSAYCALIYLDLDNFKDINDAFGHQQGDQFLIEISQRLRKCVRDDETVARIGGDEFVVLIKNLGTDPIAGASNAVETVKRVLESMAKPVVLLGSEHDSSASAGVILFGDRPSSGESLLQSADLAMYQAKALGKNTYRFFDSQMQENLDERLLLANELRQSIVHKQLELHFQPQIDGALKVSGGEALLRWKNPTYGNISPGIFIPLAEKIGFIKQIGGWVLEQSCIELARWAKLKHMSGLKMAVNISPLQFQHPDFTETVVRALKSSGASPEMLKFELTESMLLNDLTDVNKKINTLKDLGIALSLDDFGTGYSSLNYLKRLSIDQLKIDQSFVRDVLIDEHGAAIARTIVALGHALGLEVIAEGVETLGQQEFLQGIGCAAFQGYLYSRPIPSSDFETFTRLH